MRFRGLLAALLVGSSIVAFATEADPPSLHAYLAPAGGFSPYNSERVLGLPDGKAVPATLENAVLDLFMRAGEGHRVRLVMYSFSARHMQDALLDAADRGADVRLLLDGVNEFAAGSRQELLDKVVQRGSKVQVRVVPPETMRRLGRVHRHKNGREFVGSMHEKFGVFLGEEWASAFVGSSNLSYSSDSMFAENRIVAHRDPELCDLLIREFTRLWNRYGKDAVGDCRDLEEPGSVQAEGAVRFVSNSGLGEERISMTATVRDLMQPAVREGGRLDIAMFYLTRQELARELLRAAAAAPKMRIRLLLDQQQIDLEEDVEVLGPWLDEQAAAAGLRNLEIRYVWNPDAYGWDPEREPPGPAKVFSLAPFLMHHKYFLVNGDTLVNGSFNWTDLGEENLENLLVVRDGDPWSHEAIRRFAVEFKHLWTTRGLPGGEARARKAEIYHRIRVEHADQAVQGAPEPPAE